MIDSGIDLERWGEALTWTLVHFLWQGAAIAAVLEVALVALRRRSSDARYLARVLGLAALAVAPVVTYAVLLAGGSNPALELEFEGLGALLASGPARAVLPPWIVPLWAAGAAFFSLRLFADWLRVRRLTRAGVGRGLPASWNERFETLAEALGVRAVARVIESAALATPAVVGWLRPMVLVPARVLTGLSEAQVLALLAHELAHVRRCDYLVNLVQSVLEALLFYHPAVWWISAGLRTEREYCCDDVAVALGADGVAYARALTELEAWRGAELSIGVSTRGGSLMQRIQRLVGVRTERGARGTAHVLAVLLLAASTGGAALAVSGAERQDAQAAETGEAFRAPERGHSVLAEELAAQASVALAGLGYLGGQDDEAQAKADYLEAKLKAAHARILESQKKGDLAPAQETLEKVRAALVAADLAQQHGPNLVDEQGRVHAAALEYLKQLTAGHAEGGEGVTVRVLVGDTVQEIARRALGDARRWREVLDANPGLAPRRLQVGEELHLPDGTLKALKETVHHAQEARNAALRALKEAQGPDILKEQLRERVLQESWQRSLDGANSELKTLQEQLHRTLEQQYALKKALDGLRDGDGAWPEAVPERGQWTPGPAAGYDAWLEAAQEQWQLEPDGAQVDAWNQMTEAWTQGGLDADPRRDSAAEAQPWGERWPYFTGGSTGAADQNAQRLDEHLRKALDAQRAQWIEHLRHALEEAGLDGSTQRQVLERLRRRGGADGAPRAAKKKDDSAAI